MAEENNKSTLPLHLHVMKVGKCLDIAQLNIKSRQSDVENDIIRCPCCGHTFDQDDLENKIILKKHNQSLNACDYSQFKCPNCEAIIRTDPYFTEKMYGDIRKQLLNGNVIWLNSIEDFDHIPNDPGYSFEFDNSLRYNIILMLLIASAIIGGPIAIAFEMLLAAIPCCVAAIALTAYWCFCRKNIMRLYNIEEKDEIPKDDHKDVEYKHFLHYYY